MAETQRPHRSAHPATRPTDKGGVESENLSLRTELRYRVQEIEALSLQVKHLQADLTVKDEYIATLESQLRLSPTDWRHAKRYLALRRLVGGQLRRHPRLERVMRPLIRVARKI